MHPLIIEVNDFLDKVKRGEETFPSSFIEEMNINLTEYFSKKEEQNREFKLYISNLGWPLCKLQMANSATIKSGGNDASNNLPFVVGNMVEQYLFMVFKAALQNEYKVETNVKGLFQLEDIERNYYYDISIDDEIYDIKVISPNSYRKFERGFSELYKDDPYGYVVQGALYEHASGKPFKGWIAMNKVNGDLCICEVPVNWETKYKPEAIALARANIRAVEDGVPFKRCFEDEEELWYKKPTGNRILNYSCVYCDYRAACWPNTQHRPNPLSKSKQPNYVYYTKFVEKKDGE